MTATPPPRTSPDAAVAVAVLPEIVVPVVEPEAVPSVTAPCEKIAPPRTVVVFDALLLLIVDDSMPIVVPEPPRIAAPLPVVTRPAVAVRNRRMKSVPDPLTLKIRLALLPEMVAGNAPTRATLRS